MSFQHVYDIFRLLTLRGKIEQCFIRFEHAIRLQADQFGHRGSSNSLNWAEAECLQWDDVALVKLNQVIMHRYHIVGNLAQVFVNINDTSLCRVETRHFETTSVHATVQRPEDRKKLLHFGGTFVRRETIYDRVNSE
jgi:hypothetical protein